MPYHLHSKGKFSCQVNQSPTYVHSCLELNILKTSTNNHSQKSVVHKYSAKPSLSCQFGWSSIFWPQTRLPMDITPQRGYHHPWPMSARRFKNHWLSGQTVSDPYKLTSQSVPWIVNLQTSISWEMLKALKWIIGTLPKRCYVQTNIDMNNFY